MLHCLAADDPDWERRIKWPGKGIGDVTVNIFLREMRSIWPKAQPLPSKQTVQAAKALGLIANDLADGLKPEDFPVFEAALVRYGLAMRKRA